MDLTGFGEVLVQFGEFCVPRMYLHGRSKSDRIDTLTVAKMPFIDS